MFCGKCGANVPDGYEFCMKCGTKIEINQLETNDENESSKRINKKLLIPVIVIILVMFIAMGLIFGLKVRQEKSGYFANIPWGTGVETVKEKVDRTFKCESFIGEDENSVSVMIADYDGMKGVTAFSVFYCKDNGTLNEVGIILTAEDESDYTGDQVIKEVVAKYDKLFGKNDNSKDFSYIWETPNSTVELVSFSEELIMMTFKK